MSKDDSGIARAILDCYSPVEGISGSSSYSIIRNEAMEQGCCSFPIIPDYIYSKIPLTIRDWFRPKDALPIKAMMREVRNETILLGLANDKLIKETNILAAERVRNTETMERTLDETIGLLEGKLGGRA